MRRRPLLVAATGLAAGSGGCLAGLPATGTDTFTVSNPPESLRERGACDEDWVRASVSFAGPLDEVGDEAAVVPYRDLADPAKLVVRYYLDRGSAVACEGDDPTAFQSLLSALTDASDRYRERHDEPPENISVRVADSYYRLDRLLLYDQVLEG
ncbi:hypothetical protein [Halorubellus litoreus]|uniref:Lipoprotein n=1 Tax=Halorubellus litoreus TaxID=755308 RepID=A0ABD5VDT4_9EURY